MSSKILDGKGLALIAEEEIQRQVSELKNEGMFPLLPLCLLEWIQPRQHT